MCAHRLLVRAQLLGGVNARLLRQLDLLILEEDLPSVLEYCTFPGGKVRAHPSARV